MIIELTFDLRRGNVYYSKVIDLMSLDKTLRCPGDTWGPADWNISVTPG